MKEDEPKISSEAQVKAVASVAHPSQAFVNKIKSATYIIYSKIITCQLQTTFNYKKSFTLFQYINIVYFL